MELRQYAAVIWKWSWLIVLAAAVAGFSSWYAVKDQPAIYETSTTLMIGQAIQKVNPDYTDFYTSQQLGQTYTELVTREPILKATARALGFEEEWRSLQGQVAVTLIEGTQLMEIKVTDTDPLRAQLVTDELARQLIATVERARPRDENRAFIQEQAASLPPKIQAAQQEIRDLEVDLSTAFSARQIQEVQGRITTLENQINNWQATFAQYQLLLGDTGVNVLTVIEEAPLPTVPVGPNWWLQVALAAAIGAMLAVAAAFVIEYLDDTVRTTNDLERVTGSHPLGVITKIPGDKPADRLIAALHPKSPISESYRALRTSLRFTSPDRPVRTLLVTSPSALEGKSTTAANLAVVMAQAGNSVVLLDADLRRPTQHRIFGLPNKEGLTSVLVNERLNPDGWLRETAVANLRVLTSGPLPPNPSELLGSQRMQRLLDAILAEADMVILDTPPILPVTDAAVLAPQTDGVLIVTEAGRTREGAMRRALGMLQQVGAKVLGVTLNRVSAGGGRYYYYYYYYSDGQGRRKRRKKRKQQAPLTDAE
jgi:non-specific protein-tyrosine kinase